MNFRDRIGEFDATWAAVTAAATVIIALIANMAAPPPTLWREAAQVPDVLEFIVIIILSASISGRKSKGWKNFKWFLPLIPTIVCIVAYYVLTTQFSCPFTDNRMAIGWTYIATAAEYISQNPGQDCSLLIADYIGNTNMIWPAYQIIITWLVIYFAYVLAVAFSAMTVVRAIQHVSTK
ncbi:hypothetical protein HJB82_23925 [Rhizobium sp. NZLR10]|uniref:hypothetical protein n=1 Tax=Rhizobium sp. NZLR10 TaxID=2731097 RepID=UPI001C82C470|nr:hypothetical protein [Rhizobium sp. NZLR10]MBX5198332.1 hypothetical protein [Rhizobium sp. NZLR10]